MKNFLLVASLCLVGVFSQAAPKTYYVSPTGSDSNPGTITAPFASWQKLSGLMVAGDIAYIRGGTYRTTGSAGTSTHCLLQNLTGTAAAPIKIWAYPGEFPIFNLDNITTTNSDPTALIIRNCRYVHIKGLRVTGLKQITSGTGVSRGIDLQNSSNNTIEFVELDHIGGYGFILSDGSNDNYFLNCDAHHMDDRYTNDGGAWGNANGFQCTGGSNATRNTFEGCRAWWISDDGFDLYSTDGVNTFKNCWAFWNGYEPGTFISRGDGDGFKLGPDNSGTVHNTVLRTVSNCLSFENKGSGFDQNNGDMRYVMFNNTTYKNGSYGFMFDYISPAPAQDFRNNLSYRDLAARRGNETTGSYNSWNGGVSVSNNDFLGVTSTGMDGARNADGSLPVLNFMRLNPTSGLVNTGTSVGLPFVGTAPDKGAFEAGSVVLPIKIGTFTAVAYSGKTLLKWTTESEANSDFFQVERSLDGSHYTALGVVNAAGSSSATLNYEYIDYDPKPGVNYYRLKLVDRDGQYEYSKVLTVVYKTSSSSQVTVVSSGVVWNKLNLVLSSPSQQTATIAVFDAAGRILMTSSAELQVGENTINRNMTVASSVYYCKIITNEGSFTVPVVKQ